MMKDVETTLDGTTLVVRIPMRFERRGGRKRIVAPDGSELPPTPKPRRNDTLIKALVRAHRWRRRIESGRAKSITDLAEQEGVTDAYVCRLLPLNLPCPRDRRGNSRRAAAEGDEVGRDAWFSANRMAGSA
jgi:hypothetical protein